MASSALKRLQDRLVDTKRLIEIHTECTGSQPGRRHGYDALNRSAVILAVAAWEGYCEDIAQVAVGHVARRLRSSADLPSNVQDAMLAYLYESQGWSKLNSGTKSTIWGLADQGWRQAYVGYARSRINALNTPDYPKVKKRYASICGLPDFTVNWGAGRWNAAHYQQLLDETLKVRPRIAHGAIGSVTVGKGMAKEAASLIRRIGGWTDSTVIAHLQNLPTRPLIRVRERP